MHKAKPEEPVSTDSGNGNQQETTLLRAIVRDAVDGIIVIDERGHIVLMNPAAERLFGYRRQEVLKRNICLLMPDPYSSQHDQFLQRYLETGEKRIIGIGREVTGRRKDGTTFPMHLSVAEIYHHGQRSFLGIIRDLTEAKRIEEQLKESETRHRLILDAALDAVILIDLQGMITGWNPQAETIFGFTREEALGRRLSDTIIPPRYREAHEQGLKHFAQAGYGPLLNQRFEITGWHRRGYEFPIELSIVPVHIGETVEFCGFVRDITEPKQREEKLVWLSRALQQSPVAVIITNAEGNIEYVNPKFTRLTGYTAEEVIGKNPRILQSGNTLLADYQRLWETIRSGKEWQGEIQNKRKNGELYWAREHITAIKTPEGKITHFIAIQEDITERKQIKEALERSEARFRQIAEMTGEWIWEQDPNGRYTYSSAAVREILGYAPEEIINRQYYEFFTPEDRRHWEAQIPDISMVQQRFFRIINHYRHKDGHEVFTESTGEPILDEQGRLTGWRGVDRDISRQVEAEALIHETQVKLAVTRNELKIARRIQKSLLPSASLKLPAVHVVGYCLPAAQVGGDYFDYFQRPGQHIDVVIADVSGHAVGSALFMVETRSALKTQLQLERKVADTLALLNESLFEDLNRADHFITMFYMRYNATTRELTYANAGHNQPLLLREKHPGCVQLDADGLILGVKRDVSFEEKLILLEPGDTVFLYTDGLTEAESQEGEFFGSERLCDLLAQHLQATPQELIDIVLTELHDFCGNTAFNDDVTMVVLKVL